MSLAITLPAALTDAGITGKAADQLAESTRVSAGTTITQSRIEGTGSSLGAQTPQAIDALSAGFADATRIALLIATVFLVLGFVGASRLRRAAAKSHAASTHA